MKRFDIEGTVRHPLNSVDKVTVDLTLSAASIKHAIEIVEGLIPNIEIVRVS